jgi:hypothetical protein
MTQSIAILGRQPALGLAELESLYGAEALHPISQQIALLDVDPTEVDFKRLGGTVKLAKLLTSLNNTSFKSVVAYIAKTVPDHLQYIPEGKIRLGLNVYGLDVKVEEINRASLEIKKAIKKAGRSVRAVPNSSNQLNSAQTLHNQLAGPTGLEFVIIRNGTSTLLAQVTNVQDINGYAARDQARPRRDAQVGMLPPKLAQTIINLSGVKEALLDPFCGTGVILQEATLMGLGAYGTDLEPRMTEYSQANLDWLRAETKDVRLEVGDATDFKWSQPFDAIAAETYLGRPFSSDPSVEVLGQVSRDVDTIHRKFLKNLAKQTEPGFTASLAVPAWKIRNGFKHLPCLDSLEELGYTRRSFVHVSDSDLVYHRPEQIVGRELVVITRK